MKKQEEARRLLRYFAIPEQAEQTLWNKLDTVYFLRHSAEEIAWHGRALHYRSDSQEPVVKARLNPHGDGIEVMVHTQDQRELLPAWSASSDVPVITSSTRIHTTRHGYALDSFMLLDVTGRDSDRNMISYIEHELSERLTTKRAPEPPVNGRISRQVKHFPIELLVTIQPDEKGFTSCSRSAPPTVQPAVHGGHGAG